MHRKKFRLLRMNPKYWIAIVLLLVVLFAGGYAAQQRQLDAMLATAENLTAEQEQLVNEILRLQRKIEFTQTDEFIEREARSKLGLVNEGEILFKSTD